MDPSSLIVGKPRRSRFCRALVMQMFGDEFDVPDELLSDGPDEPDGPWAKGWNERAGE